jgi:hypothetical protein
LSWMQSWLGVSRGILAASAIWASILPFVVTHRWILRTWRRRRARDEGVDLCYSCIWSRPLRPDEQTCPTCGAPRACAVCGHHLEADQCACPECGRKVSGRLFRSSAST